MAWAGIAITLAVLATGLLVWLLLTPLVLRGVVRGSLEDGVEAEGRISFWPISSPITTGEERAPTVQRAAVSGGRATSDRLQEQFTVREIAGFVWRSLRHVQVRSLDCDVRFGCDDPALTGEILGYALAWGGVLGPRARLVVVPDWTFEDVLEGELKLDVSIAVAALAWDAAMFLLGKLWRERRQLRQRVAARAV